MTNADSIQSHLSRISTMWTVLRDAHADGDQQSAAQTLLVECYGPAVKRYLLAITRDSDIADDLFQTFMTRLLSGAFHNVSPEKGKFRSYVKAVLSNLVSREFRTRQRDAAMPLQAEPIDEPSDRDFDDCWRQQLLDRSWTALEDAQPRYFRVLRARHRHPDASSADLIELLSEHDRFTNDSFRRTLSRARNRFAMLLIDEVGRSVEPASRERVEDELADLGLLEYCRDVLDNHSKRG